MKIPFRMRQRKQGVGYKHLSESPPVDIVAVGPSGGNPYEDVNKERWALQKGFASQLVKLSRKHLNDNNRQQSQRRQSPAEDSKADQSNIIGQQIQSRIPLRKTRTELHESQQKLQQKSAFQMACGGSPVDSTTDVNKDTQQQPKQQQRPSPAGVASRKRAPQCDAPLKSIRCSGADESSVTLPTFAPHCFLFSDWCPSSLFQDKSENDETDGEDKCRDSALNFASRLIKVTPFGRQKSNTKKNGIPNVITIPVAGEPARRKPGCWSPFGCNQSSSPPLQSEGPENLSFDSSIIRLEDTLMKANMNADIEDKYDTPMHHPKGHRRREQLDLTADATTVTSSISTHSSFKVGASIIRLPEKLAPMI